MDCNKAYPDQNVPHRRNSFPVKDVGTLLPDAPASHTLPAHNGDKVHPVGLQEVHSFRCQKADGSYPI